MSYELSFDSLVDYDTGVPGISIAVQLRNGSFLADVIAKVDSGADRCIFSRECGELLGVEIESGEFQSFRTGAGPFVTYGHPVLLITEGITFDTTIYFARDNEFDRNLLGRFGWLDRVVIGINDYDGKLYLSRYSSE